MTFKNEDRLVWEDAFRDLKEGKDIRITVSHVDDLSEVLETILGVLTPKGPVMLYEGFNHTLRTPTFLQRPNVHVRRERYLIEACNPDAFRVYVTTNLNGSYFVEVKHPRNEIVQMEWANPKAIHTFLDRAFGEVLPPHFLSDLHQGVEENWESRMALARRAKGEPGVKGLFVETLYTHRELASWTIRVKIASHNKFPRTSTEELTLTVHSKDSAYVESLPLFEEDLFALFNRHLDFSQVNG